MYKKDDRDIESGREGINVVYNSYSSRLLDKIISCLYFDEPCLLVGDTGCGKTTLTQHCADLF